MGARLRMAFNCCGSKDEEKLPRESLPQPAKESLGNTTSHVEHYPAAPARSNATWFCGQPMAISQQAPAPAPAVRAPEPQEEVFHEVVNENPDSMVHVFHEVCHKVDLSNTDSMMAIDTLIGMKKGLWEKYDKDKYDKKDGILSRKEAGKMLDKFMLGNFLKTFINDLPLIPADKVSALLPVRSACIELLLHRPNCSSPNHPSRPKRSWSLCSYPRWMQTRCAQPLCCSADCEAQDGV